MSQADNDALREQVRTRYGAIARSESSRCCGGGEADNEGYATYSAKLGYAAADLAAVPVGANMGLGCGNPHLIAGLKLGETVLDLGSGGGLDCFLASRRVGPQGKVIGVDMTPDMVTVARRAARDAGYSNVEFRLGEIEHLPLADGSVDVVISNCVVNLSPDKPSVFSDAFRVLRPGGRLAISDVVAIKPLPESMRADPNAHCSCLSGAAAASDIERMLRDAGFADVTVDIIAESSDIIAGWGETCYQDFVRSALITGVKR